MPVWSPSAIFFQLHVRLADEPEALVGGTLLFEVVRQQVGVHLHFEQSHAGPVGFVDVLGGFGVELEGGEDDDPGFGHEGVGFLKGESHLALLQRRMVRAETDDGALGCECGGEIFAYPVRAAGIGADFGFGVEGAAGKWLHSGEHDSLSLFAADTGLLKFVAPFFLA